MTAWSFFFLISNLHFLTYHLEDPWSCPCRFQSMRPESQRIVCCWKDMCNSAHKIHASNTCHYFILTERACRFCKIKFLAKSKNNVTVVLSWKKSIKKILNTKTLLPSPQQAHIRWADRQTGRQTDKCLKKGQTTKWLSITIFNINSLQTFGELYKFWF